MTKSELEKRAESAYEEGYQARCDGIWDNQNPYSSSLLCISWHAGWHAANGSSKVQFPCSYRVNDEGWASRLSQ